MGGSGWRFDRLRLFCFWRSWSATAIAEAVSLVLPSPILHAELTFSPKANRTNANTYLLQVVDTIRNDAHPWGTSVTRQCFWYATSVTTHDLARKPYNLVSASRLTDHQVVSLTSHPFITSYSVQPKIPPWRLEDSRRATGSRRVSCISFVDRGPI